MTSVCFKHQVHLQESVSERATVLHDVLASLDLLHFSTDGLHHVLYNSPFIDLSYTNGSSQCPCATLQVRPDLQTILEVDHALLLCETLFRSGSATLGSKHRRRLRANVFRSRPCKMMVTSDEATKSFAYSHVTKALREEYTLQA